MSANQEHQILTECRQYVIFNGDDLELPDYLRLTAKVWEILGRNSAPDMGPVDEIIQHLTEKADIDRGDFLPFGWPVSHPEHGPAASKAHDSIDADIRASLGALTWKGIYS